MSPPQSPSKKQRGVSIPSIQSSIKTFFSPTLQTKRKKSGDSPPTLHSPTLTEDTITFTDVEAPNVTYTSDDTLQRPFSVDYLTKYRMPAGEVDSLPNESDLDVASNASRHGEQASELFPEIDARYDHTERALVK